jgi:signal transduction histidine kinase
MSTRVLQSSTFRLALIYMSFFIGSVFIILVLIYWSTVSYLTRQTDIVIDSEVTSLVNRYQIGGLTELSFLLNERLLRKPTGLSVYLLSDSNLNPVLGNLDRWPLDVTVDKGWVDFNLHIKKSSDFDVHPVRARIFRLEGDLLLLVGRDIHELETTKRLIVEALLTSLFVMLVLVAIGSMLLSRYTLRRIEIINKASYEIMSMGLSHRIPSYGTGDEFDVLADNLNAMLDKIDSLMTSIKHVSDNIAHDLRTPLSRLRNHLEELHIDIEESDQCYSRVEQAIVEVDDMLVSFNSLLRIVGIESEEAVSRFQSVDLSRLIKDIVELYEPLIEHNEQILETEIVDVAPITGDRDMLFQAISNLVDNAIKYSPKNGLIQISLEQYNNKIKFIVADSGSGIPTTEREKVFQRFYRLDKSRNTPGNGLGLSLVHAVIKLHKIDIYLEDNHPGLKVVIVFPQK